MHKYEPNEVFTPRSRIVNERMYVDRIHLETALQAAAGGTQHIVLYGDSGTGKTWLCRHVLGKGQQLYVANMATASRLGSITAELQNRVNIQAPEAETGYVERKSVEAGALVMKGQISHERKVEFGKRDPFETLLRIIRTGLGHSRPAWLLFENLEAIFDTPQLMSELADLITLLDDPEYGQYEVRLILIGTSHGFREYYARTPNRSTIANRLRELPEVGRLEPDECALLIDRGFRDLLAFQCDRVTLDAIIEHITWVTDRVPQCVHEYCLAIASRARSDGAGTHLRPAHLPPAREAWLQESLLEMYSAMERHLNERDARHGRRNQLLYALGSMDQSEFRSSDVEAVIRREFPDSCGSKALKVGSALSELVTHRTPLLKRTHRGDAFIFRDSRLRLCLRAALSKEGETVTKLDLRKA